jgi:hypothetical protein
MRIVASNDLGIWGGEEGLSSINVERTYGTAGPTSANTTDVLIVTDAFERANVVYRSQMFGCVVVVVVVRGCHFGPTRTVR